MNRTIRASLTLAVVAVAALASLGGAATASAATAPSIEGESVLHITATDATIEAQINPGGLETTYEVWVGAYPECIEERLEPCESTGEGPAGTGAIVATIPASSSPHTISVDIAKAWHPLSPSSSYIYHVDATNSNWAYEGSAYGENKIFETAAASAPLIEGESVSHVSGSDATLEAEINSEGLPTTYEFHLASPPCPMQCEHLQHIFTLPSGKLLGSFVTQSVSLELNSAGVRLDPGERYEYWVTATNSDGTGGSQSNAHTFTASSEEPPSIVSEGVSNITATDATLEAAIEPRAWHGAYYQFQLVKEASEYASEILCPPTLHPGIDGCVGPQGADALPIGWVCGSCETEQAAQSVQLDLASAGVTLEPSTTYHFRVIAARAVQTEDTIQWEPPTVFGADQTFTTPSELPPPNAQTSGTDGQLPAIQSPPSTSPTHHKKHKRHRHRAKLHRAKRAG